MEFPKIDLKPGEICPCCGQRKRGGCGKEQMFHRDLRLPADRRTGLHECELLGEFPHQKPGLDVRHFEDERAGDGFPAAVADGIGGHAGTEHQPRRLQRAALGDGLLVEVVVVFEVAGIRDGLRASGAFGERDVDFACVEQLLVQEIGDLGNVQIRIVGVVDAAVELEHRDRVGIVHLLLVFAQEGDELGVEAGDHAGVVSAVDRRDLQVDGEYDQQYDGSAVGDGQYDAFVKALRYIYKKYLDRTFPILANYQVTIPPGGRTDALVQTVISWHHEGGLLRTRGLDADQTEAAIKATFKMLNIIENELTK